jgi:uncharacterized protein (DUF2235 family)
MEGQMKHLIFLIDGTWVASDLNVAGQIYSNIYMINLSLMHTDAQGHPQIVFYTRGIGSTSSLRKYTAGGFAEGIDEMITDIYGNLVANYEPGDKIYLFGFSRGAVIARAVTGLVGRFGLLRASRMDTYSNLWRQFVTCQPLEDESFLATYRSSLRRDIKVEFIGAFDTVFGGNESKGNMLTRLRFSSRRLEPCVNCAVHILALDEDRKRFSCMTWDQKKPEQHLEQIWMPGVHSDIGGVYPESTLGELSLLTMIDRVRTHTGLQFFRELDVNTEGIRRNVYYGNVTVNYEKGWWTRSARQLNSDDPEQFLHQIAPILKTRNVTYKKHGKRTLYSIPNPFSSLRPMIELKGIDFDQV